MAVRVPRAGSVFTWSLAGILLVAFGLRAYGVGFGLPHLYYWDEPTVVNRAVRFGSGDLDPHFFYYPAFYMYVLFAVSGGYYVLGRITGHFASSVDFAVEYFTDPSHTYVAARLTTALLGTASVLLAYKVGRRFFGREVGLAAAAVLAVSVVHGSYSHVAITDVPQAFFITAAYLPLHDVLTRSRPRDYLFAGVLIGLGMATKYLAFLLLPTLIAAHFARRTRDAGATLDPRALLPDAVDRRLWLALLATGATFFVATPYNVLRFHEFVDDYRTQAALSTGGGELHPWLFLLRSLALDLGGPGCLAAVAGLVVVVRARSREGLLFLTFPVVYGLAIARLTRVFARYLIPEDPLLAVLAGAGIVALAGAVPVRFRSAAMVTATGIACLFPATSLFRWDRLMASTEDPRTTAVAWAEESLPAGASVAIQPLYDRTFYNAPLVTDAAIDKLGREMPAGGRFGAARERVLDAVRAHRSFHLVPWKADLGALSDEGARYVFTSSLDGPLDPGFAAQLANQATIARAFAPDPVRADGIVAWPDVFAVMPPEITVYAVR
jgi:4-amino-4-deoxy-L-arabinose transferase-like glycosyltransferase